MGPCGESDTLLDTVCPLYTPSFYPGLQTLHVFLSIALPHPGIGVRPFLMSKYPALFWKDLPKFIAGLFLADTLFVSIQLEKGR